ncbi:hypothetical protein PMAYCL1PPCAC_33355, partial [Pristionchus mayeri]
LCVLFFSLKASSLTRSALSIHSQLSLPPLTLDFSTELALNSSPAMRYVQRNPPCFFQGRFCEEFLEVWKLSCGPNPTALKVLILQHFYR